MASLSRISSALSPLELAGLILAVSVIYSISVAIYNLFFHPLTRFPGPKIAAANHIWYGCILTKGIAPHQIAKLHEKYGPVIRVAPDELSFSSPAAWKDIYGYKRSGQPEMSKDKRYHAGLSEPILINADREYHSSLRKLLSHGFADSALRAQEDIIQNYLKQFMEQLEKYSASGQNTINLEHWYQFFTFDVIGHLTNGQSYDCMEAGKLHPFIKISLSFVRFLSLKQAMMRFPTLLRLPFAKYFIRANIMEDMKTKDEFSKAKVNYRLETPSEIPDIMGKLVDYYKSGKMSFNQLAGNSELSILAGSETTATELSGLTYLLMTNQGALDKLTAEVPAEFSSPEEITMARVNNCGATVDGKYVPEGMVVGVTILAASRSATNFTSPDSFIPERWIGDDPTYARDRKDAVQPFSYGPRNCIGRNLAYVEMKLVLANIIWRYDLVNCTADGWLDQKVYILWEKGPVNVKLIPRKTK